jgi:hypothetical protein
LFFFFLGFQATAQTVIWSEDFNSYNDKTTSGTAGGTVGGDWQTAGYEENWWPSNYVTGVYVNSHYLIGRYTSKSGRTKFETGSIAISGYYSVKVSMQISSSVNLENEDSLQLFYVLDGGTPILFFNRGGNISADNVTTSIDLSAGYSTLVVYAVIQNNQEDEYYGIDNIVMEGCPNVELDCSDKTVYTTPVNGRILYFPMNGASSSEVTNTEGSSGWVQNGFTWDSGVLCNALYLDGADDYVSFSSNDVNALTDFSISAWVYWNGSTEHWSRIFDFGASSTVNMFLTTDANDGYLRFAMTKGGNGAEERITTQTTLSENWHHLVVTLEGSVGTLYLDGEVIGTNTGMTLTPAVLSTSAWLDYLWIGRSQYSADPYFNGLIDEFLIYNRALTKGEVKTLAATGTGEVYVSAPLSGGCGTVTTTPRLAGPFTTGAYTVAWEATDGNSTASCTQKITVVDNNDLVTITTQPVETTWCSGDEANYTVGVTDLDASYQWEATNTASASWWTVGNDKVYSFTAEPYYETEGWKLRVIVSSGRCSIVSDEVAILVNDTKPSVPIGSSPQDFCGVTNPTIANLVATGTNIQWYNVATGGTPLNDTDPLVDGTYYASQTVDGCESDDRLAITVTVGEVTVTCPSNTSYDCYSGLPVIADFGDLVDAGGSYTNTCGELTDLSLEVKDVIVPSTSSASGNCEVERTFTVTDGTTALDSCTQIITLTGTTPPSFRDADGSDYLPAYTSTTPGCVQEIPLPDFEGSCSGVTYSVTQVSGTTVSDLAIDTDAKVLTGTFPAGTYTLEWTIDDVCGYGTATANQLVEVTQPEITYDGFALDELPDGVGSGVKPMSSSTHTYTVDGATASDGYTYRWTITKDSDASVAYATGSGNSETNISVEFTAADYDQGSYTIEVIKSNGSCSVTLERSIEVQINSFDASVTGENSLCQSGETSTATQIKWTVTFPAIDSEPFDFNYTITLNGSTACTGSVSEITYTSSSFDHDSGCAPSGSSATPPFIEIDKSADSYELTVSYTVPNQTATDFDYGIQITASDKYAVSDPEVENDSFSTTAHGVPATSAITTD